MWIQRACLLYLPHTIAHMVQRHVPLDSMRGWQPVGMACIHAKGSSHAGNTQVSLASRGAQYALPPSLPLVR